MDGYSLLQKAVIFDIETLGLSRGSGLHELAVYDLEKQKIYELIIEPNVVFSRAAKSQDILGLASSQADVQVFHPAINASSTWQDVLRLQADPLKGATSNMDMSQIMRQLRAKDSWLYQMLKKGTYPHLPDSKGKVAGEVLTNEKRLEALRALGSKATVLESEKASIQEVLKPGSKFLSKLQGKVIWGANIAFDAKQLGSRVAAMERAEMTRLGISDLEVETTRRQVQKTTGLRDVVRLHNPKSPDVLYVTGAEVNQAKVAAQTTGDWTHVWRAYVKHTKGGDVRDIIDVLKAQQSYGRQLGLFKTQGQNFGLGMDISFRLFGSAEADPTVAAKLFGMPELHRAYADTALTEAYVLEHSIKQTSALQAVAENRPEAKELIAQARKGQGLLYQAHQTLNRLSTLAPELQEINLFKRFDRAFQGLAVAGKTSQFIGHNRLVNILQEASDRTQELVPILMPKTKQFSSIESVFEFIQKSSQYADLDPKQMQSAYEGYTSYLVRGGALEESVSGFSIKDADRLSSLSSAYVSGKTGKGIEGIVEKIASGEGIEAFLSRTQVNTLPDELFRPSASQSAIAKFVDKQGVGKLSSRILGFGLGVSILAGIIGSKHGEPLKEGTQSLRDINYQKWLQYQQNFYDMEPANSGSGFPENGIAGQTRKEQTDFGSPYAGPWTSSRVFMDQKLIAARENYLQGLYVQSHFGGDVQSISNELGAFNSAIGLGQGNYNYLTEGVSPIDSEQYSGIKGQNLLQINLKDKRWKVNYEDADTVVVKRGGIRGAISSFFGLNRGYSFRLAGIDAPETAHGSQSFYAPQPMALSAREALSAWAGKSEDLNLVFDPTNITYGRPVGVLMAGSRNMNLELVKRGFAAALPYHSKSQPIIDYSAVLAQEQIAKGAGVGIHKEPFFQAYYDIVANNKRLTFNTLAKTSTIAQNSTLMSAASLMKQAQEQGFYGTADRIAASEINQRIKDYGTNPDGMSPILFRLSEAPHKTYIDEMLYDTGTLMKTKGGKYYNKLSRRSGYGELDQTLVLDTMGTSTSSWSRRQLATYNMYGMNSERLNKMAELQREANRTMFNSPINHYAM